MDELFQLLTSNIVLNDLFYSHVSLTQPKGKFRIATQETIERFWELYQPRPDVALGLAEVPQMMIPILFDMDLVFQSDVNVYPNKMLYSDEYIRECIQAIQEVLRETIVDIQEQDLQCVYLSKRPYSTYKGGNLIYKNGFHLHFPRIFLSRVDQEIHIIPQLLHKLPHLEDVVDRKAISNTWLMYGSRKSPENEPYLVNSVFNSALEIVPIEEAFLDYTLFDAYDGLLQITRDTVTSLLPRILSIIANGRKVFHVHNTVQCLKQHILQAVPPLEHPQHARTPADLSFLRKLTELLKPIRAVGHDSWMMVGWTLFNLTNGSNDGRDIWVRFSQQTPDHNEARCIYEWVRIKPRNITIGTLKFFAKQDNLAGYQALLIEQQKSKIGSNITAYSMAKFLFEHCGEEFVYSKQTWYHFVGHYWQVADEGIELRKRIHGIIHPYIQAEIQSTCREKAFLDPLSQKDTITQLSKQEERLRRVLADLEDTHMKNKIMNECREVFHDQEFDVQLDKNRFLFGFENGVYDLKSNTFREGYPSDKITNHAPIRYVEFTDDDPLVQEVKRYFEKVFVHHELRRYFYDIMSEIFEGYNYRKNVYFFTGGGDNAKSVTQMFFEKMMGRLSIKSPTSLIMSKRSGTGSANAELARSGNGVRMNWLEEPDADDEIYDGAMKGLSGNDSYFARDLFQKGKDVREIEPMFKIFVVCNDLPRVRKGGDKATWNRIRVIPFNSTFCKDAPSDIEEQFQQCRFPVDPTIAQRIPHLIEPLAWFLLQHRLQPRIPDPKIVRDATESYMKTNDIIDRFATLHMIPDKENRVTMTAVFDLFKLFTRSVGLAGAFDRIRFEQRLLRLKGNEMETISLEVYKGFRLDPGELKANMAVDSSNPTY
jgi:P4 family phage/plasmid primase-like protien